MSNPNNVNAENFNETMIGYVDYALDFFRKVLTDDEESEYGKYTEEQISQLEQIFFNGISWAKNDMTMENARTYKRKR